MNLRKYLIPGIEAFINIDKMELDEYQRYLIDAIEKLMDKYDVTMNYKNYLYELNHLDKSISIEDFMQMVDSIYDKFDKIKVKKVDTIILNTDKNVKAKYVMDSKFGGIPYLEDAPTIEDEVMICQINFAKLPSNRLLPSKGILQLWMSESHYDSTHIKFYRDPSMHKHNKNLEDEYMLRYSEDIENFFYPTIKEGILINPYITKESINYHEFMEIVNSTKYGTNEYYISSALAGPVIYNPIFKTSKMLGMDYPIQDEPHSYIKDTRLLLQICSSDPYNNFNYSDSGNIQVYIPENDLKRYNFENVKIYESSY